MSGARASKLKLRTSNWHECRRGERAKDLSVRMATLCTLRCLHEPPSKLLISERTLPGRPPLRERGPGGTRHLRGRFALRCCQRFSRPDVATQRCFGRNNWCTSGRSRPVLSYWGAGPSRVQLPVADRDRTVSRRSEPSSRAALMGEQPNPWDRLQPQDATSRHRGAKPRRRCELLGGISLLSPG